MAQEHILIVEDDADIRELVKYNLEKEGYRVSTVVTGDAALKKLRSSQPDLVVLDLMLPGVDGLTICREMRAEQATRAVPVIMLTAKSEESDVVAGLEVGADDYLPKPFSPRVLLARIHALLRRQKGGGPDAAPVILRRGELEIDGARYEVRVGGKPVILTPTEFKLLRFLAEKPGIVFSRDQIVDAIHGTDYAVTDRSVDVQVLGLRRKLKASGDCVETVRGVGYRFKKS